MKPSSPRQVTDESETSECKKKKNPVDADTNMRRPVGASVKDNVSERPQKRKMGSLLRSGPVLEEEQQSSEHAVSGPSSASNPSLPQHERIQEVEPLDISYCCTPATLQLKGVLVSRLSDVTPSGRIQVVRRDIKILGLADNIQVQRSWFLLLQIDLSRRGLGEEDAEIIRLTLRSNPQLAVLKLGDNNLGDNGATIIASSCSKDGRHHQSLTVLDLGFNGIGDQGITELSLHMIAGNHVLRNLYLSGNNFKQKGAMAIAGAILHGCSLIRLHISANKLGPAGIKVLAGAVAEMDARRQHLLQRRGGIVISAIKPPAVEELHIGDISMKTKGLVCLSQMLLSNSSLRVLNLSNNEIDDRDMAIISQALAQNKGIPLTSVQLSFNKITCVGVECFMNSIWGSQTLKEVKLDNNKMQDRGAQLCSVVLGSVRLEVLDLSFNRVSTVGVKAMMKSLSENDSLRVLSLSGIPMDQNASKAVSYALAYNSSLQVFNIDSCCVGYSGQRHIVAGIVSNRNVKLRTLTGFALGRKYQYVSSYVMCSGERRIDVFCFSF
jgi:Ran GTPase-activating protein (RanGAP) involved in mRNA processing and transport